MKTKQELALKKLKVAEKLFDELQSKLEWKEKIDKKSDIWTLALCAKNYSTGSQYLQYRSCVRMYKVFGINKNKYPDFADELKKMLRNISNKYFSKKQNPQLDLGFGY